jgi:hypothetical protein
VLRSAIPASAVDGSAPIVRIAPKNRTDARRPAKAEGESEHIGADRSAATQTPVEAQIALKPRHRNQAGHEDADGVDAIAIRDRRSISRARGVGSEISAARRDRADVPSVGRLLRWIGADVLPQDVLLGEIAGCKFYIGAAQLEYWEHTQLISTWFPDAVRASRPKRPKGCGS